jgi:hypothetical protein
MASSRIWWLRLAPNTLSDPSDASGIDQVIRNDMLWIERLSSPIVAFSKKP